MSEVSDSNLFSNVNDGRFKPRHGHSGHGKESQRSRTWKAWRSMRRRCYEKTRENYHRYGGRGIRVCKRWKDSFENFLADMGECPAGCTLDRFPDNDGNYEPGNCRWATGKEQSRNTARNLWLTYKGETLCLKDWLIRLKVAKTTFRRWFDKYGMDGAVARCEARLSPC